MNKEFTFSKLRLTLENCEILEFPSSNIDSFIVKGLYDNLSYFAEDGKVESYTKAKYIELTFNHLANKPSRNSENNLEQTPFERLTRYLDITQIELFDNDKIVFCVEPEWSDDDMDCAYDDENRYQQTVLDKYLQELEITITKENAKY